MIRLVNKNFLSPKENEVLLLIIAGLTNSQIAKKMCVSVSTVKTYVEKIYIKLQVHNRIELLVFAVKNNIIEIEKDFPNSAII